MFCIVYGCSNRSNHKTTRLFYCVAKVVVHQGGKCKYSLKNAEKMACVETGICGLEEPNRLMGTLKPCRKWLLMSKDP